MAENPKADLNIYLAKPEVNNASDILKNLGSLKSFELEISGISLCTLFVKKSYSNTPRWVKFFGSMVAPDEFGQNASTGAVLFAVIENEIFILTFGQGHHVVDSANIEMNFGLKVALNLMESSSIRSIDKSSFEQYPTQTREQTGIATDVQYFGINIERDLLRALTGKPKDEKYGTRISGMDALKLSIEVELKDLADILKRVSSAHKDNTYKNGAFAWVDHIAEVKEKTLQENLTTEIVNRINSGDSERVWLSVPEIIDWNRVVGFKYSSAASAPRHYDIRIIDLLETLKGKPLDLNSLLKRNIYCVDSDDIVVYEKPVYRFIYAEIQFQSDIYVLNNGKWYKVSSSYAEQINNFYASVPKYTKSLPDYNDETEGDYNERIAKNDPNSFVLLDKKNIRISGASSPVEPCDLYRTGNEFIHVKRYGGSSVLSHLFNQGLTSGEQFQMEPEFRKLLNDKLPDNFKIKNPDNWPNRNEYHVVFAVISESEEENLSIPFFSKISLRHVITRLQTIGFSVTVAKISVNEVKKKTKKYGSKKST